MKPYCGRNVSSASLSPTNLSTHRLLLRHQSLTSYTNSSTPTTRPPDLQSTISSRLHISTSSSYRIVFYLIVASTTVSYNLTPNPPLHNPKVSTPLPPPPSPSSSPSQPHQPLRSIHLDSKPTLTLHFHRSHSSSLPTTVSAHACNPPHSWRSSRVQGPISCISAERVEFSVPDAMHERPTSNTYIETRIFLDNIVRDEYAVR
jgi:hypothetical protein